MTDNKRYALVDVNGNVVNITSIGLIYEKVPKIEADGITVTFTETAVETTVLSVSGMIVPGDKYVNGQFVKAVDSTTQFAVIRNRDNVLMHFVDFPPDIAAAVPDPDEVADPGVTIWDGTKFTNPEPEAETEETAT